MEKKKIVPSISKPAFPLILFFISSPCTLFSSKIKFELHLCCYDSNNGYVQFP